MLYAIDWAVPGLGGADGTTGAPPPVAGVPAAARGSGLVATFGAPTTLKLLVAAVIKMTCWRCLTSSVATWLCCRLLAASASGSGADTCLITTSAPMATTTAATTVVSRKARTFLRDRRPPAIRLLCCGNAVLPSGEARHAGREAGKNRSGPRHRFTQGNDYSQ